MSPFASFIIALLPALNIDCLHVEEEKPPVYLEANVGSSAVFTCDLDFPRGEPVPYILNWNKDDRRVVWMLEAGEGDKDEGSGKVIKTVKQLEGRVWLVEASSARVSINLTEIRQPDSGWYECQLVMPNRTPATRLNGTWFHLTVHGSDLLASHPSNLTVLDGEAAKFDCTTNSEGVRVNWYKDGIPLSRVQGSLASRATVAPEGTLTIAHTDITDPGLYKCEVTATTGESQSATAYLDVQYKARVVFTPREVYLPHGREAILDCHVSANPPLNKLKWEKDGFLYDHYNVKDVSLERNGSLHFAKINKDHAGKYTCTPYNVLGSAGSSLPILVVVQHPPVFTVTPSNLYLRKIGDTVHMHCDALDGEQRPTIHWNKKDKTPLPEDRIIFEGGNLTLNNLREEDRGLYECVASNQAATVSTDTELVIENSSPRGPHDLVGNASSNSIALMWRPGYGASTHQYSIWMRVLGSNEWRSISVKSPQATISSLEPGIKYEFIVVSQDYSGEGMISKPLRISTIGEPDEGTSGSSELKSASFQEIGRPKNLRISIQDEGYLLEWDEPEFGLNLLTYYMVLWGSDYSNGEASLNTIAETKQLFHIVGSLDEDLTNYLMVRAVTVNNHYSSSEILLFYIPPQQSGWTLALGALCGFLLALIIISIYINRVSLRSRIDNLKSMS